MSNDIKEITPEEQVDAWVQGKSFHNNNRWYSVVDDKDQVLHREQMVGGECCPDFSCCNPELLWPEELRIKFKESNEQVRNEMLGMALGALLQSEKKLQDLRVYFTGQDPTQH